jgi:hypothetical protein
VLYKPEVSSTVIVTVIILMIIMMIMGEGGWGGDETSYLETKKNSSIKTCVMLPSAPSPPPSLTNCQFLG